MVTPLAGLDVGWRPSPSRREVSTLAGKVVGLATLGQKLDGRAAPVAAAQVAPLRAEVTALGSVVNSLAGASPFGNSLVGIYHVSAAAAMPVHRVAVPQRFSSVAAIFSDIDGVLQSSRTRSSPCSSCTSSAEAARATATEKLPSPVLSPAFRTPSPARELRTAASNRRLRGYACPRRWAPHRRRLAGCRCLPRCLQWFGSGVATRWCAANACIPQWVVAVSALVPRFLAEQDLDARLGTFTSLPCRRGHACESGCGAAAARARCGDLLRYRRCAALSMRRRSLAQQLRVFVCRHPQAGSGVRVVAQQLAPRSN